MLLHDFERIHPLAAVDLLPASLAPLSQSGVCSPQFWSGRIDQGGNPRTNEWCFTSTVPSTRQNATQAQMYKSNLAEYSDLLQSGDLCALSADNLELGAWFPNSNPRRAQYADFRNATSLAKCFAHHSSAPDMGTAQTDMLINRGFRPY